MRPNSQVLLATTTTLIIAHILNAANSTNTSSSCYSDDCKSYTSSNSLWLLPDGNGCADKVNDTIICPTCPDPDKNYQCQCISAANSGNIVCAISKSIGIVIGEGISKGVGAAIGEVGKIVLIVIGSLFGLCIIGGIIYCVCVGAFCFSTCNK